MNFTTDELEALDWAISESVFATAGRKEMRRHESSLALGARKIVKELAERYRHPMNDGRPPKEPSQGQHGSRG